MNIVITGCFNESAMGHFGRPAVQSMIQRAGHSVRSQLSKSTDYLVVGTANVPGRGAGPSKLQKAKSMGVKVITLDELYAILDAA